jgi:anti-sigma regulatory factor (Ser/Thr protein kinase)
MVIKIQNIEALQKALQQLANTLEQEGLSEENIFDSKLVACELLSNVLRHTDSETGLISQVADGHIELKILSEVFFKVPEKITCSDLNAEHGRGLFLVEQLCAGAIESEKDGIRVRIKIEKK